ncbi:LysR family transcriptional regulator [Terracidiphilus sp.]|uniref:LysR family transcriptional regulator n=1 Tax=Terracidiphilus sp. TaxID=1964191 RepID=UPI003C24E99C
MILRHLEFLVALAQEKHFARAAVVCGVTQSTLSAGIKQMEESLGVLLVERGQRFMGLTLEGEKVLEWAKHVIADYEGLQQSLSEMRAGLTGCLKVGAIPVTLPVISLLTTPFAKLHPHTHTVIRSLTSMEIQRGIDELSLDVGMTYLDNEPLARVRRLQLYMEHYVFLTRESQATQNRRTIPWAEAANYPLCLLTTDMQNRRIIDTHFHEAGAEVNAAIETNSLITLWSHLKFGQWSTVVPNSFLSLIGKVEGLVALPLVEPDASHAVGLVASDRNPLAPMTRALFDLAKQADIRQEMLRRIADPPADS